MMDLGDSDDDVEDNAGDEHLPAVPCQKVSQDYGSVIREDSGEKIYWAQEGDERKNLNNGYRDSRDCETVELKIFLVSDRRPLAQRYVMPNVRADDPVLFELRLQDAH